MGRRLTLLAVTACLTLTGYTFLPTSLAPTPFDVSARDGSDTQLSAEGPFDGANAVALVSDSLLACIVGLQDDYAIARLFLSATSTRSWRPEMEILTYDTDAASIITAGSENGSKVDVTASVLGVVNIDASGVLTRVAASTMTHTFSLVHEDGQWRINGPENIIFMGRVSLMASFSLANLCFPMAGDGDLVADPRWYPSRRLASHLLAGLIEGPRQSLEPVTANAIPAGMTVLSQGLDVVDGVARVELNTIVPATEGVRANLTWEFTHTLTQVVDVSQVSISLSGDVLDI